MELVAHFDLGSLFSDISKTFRFLVVAERQIHIYKASTSWLVSTFSICAWLNRFTNTFNESLILAQDERWRRA